MSEGESARPENTYRHIENKLLETLRKRQREWTVATEENREAARQQFLKALESFGGLTLYGKLPEE